MSIPRFSVPKNNFHLDLKNQVNEYFTSTKKSKTGTYALYIKAILILISYVAIYVHLLFFAKSILAQSSLLLNTILLLESALLGVLTAAIGFNIMHDGAHGSFSSYRWLNSLAGLSLNVLGANVFMWKTKHNVAHHTYTNIESVDDDLNARPLLRMCLSQKRYSIHRFQHLYFLGAYSLLYFYWVFVTDYKKYFLGRVAQTAIKDMSVAEHVSFWGFKILHNVLFIALPIYMIGFWPWLAGFAVYGAVAGIILSVVFQLAHIVEETQFPEQNHTSGKMEDEWAIIQLKTTANFANKNWFWNAFTGGLNFQIEHHLFPNISHVHYPALSLIVKNVCSNYKVPYLEHSSMSNAFASHVAHLKTMGKYYENNK
jgi:linoleoyl-CoA desaturase